MCTTPCDILKRLGAEHDTRTVDGDLSVSGLAYLSNGGIETDADGLCQ